MGPPRRRWRLLLYNRLLLGRALFTSAGGRFDRRDQSTPPALLKRAARERSLRLTAQLHSLLLKRGCDSHLILENGLLRSYCVCGSINYARHLFDDMPRKDVVSFNTMLHGYISTGNLKSAAQLFAEIPDRSLVSWTTMLGGFSAAGDVLAARNLFDRMPRYKDVIAWNAMISSYVQNDRPLEALELFGQLLAGGRPEPNQTTIASLLSACAGAGALDAGQCLFAFLTKKGFQLNAFLGSALVDLYAKCGTPDSALLVFESLSEKNSCTWNAAINGLAINGMAERALGLFRLMQLEKGITPDEITFIGVLRACSHGGFLEEGRRHFYSTMPAYGVSALLEHYACMVDLLARSACLQEAEQLIAAMSVTPDSVVWRALLGGCQLHRDVAIAERVVARLTVTSTCCSGDYVVLSNLYAAIGRWGEAARVRKAMGKTGLKKAPGWSSVETSTTINESLT